MSSHSKIGRASMMKNLISGLKHSAFPNPCPPEPWRRRAHSAIGKRGFTLMEIIVLIVMAGILIPAIIVPFVTGVRGSGKPEVVAKAMYFAHQRMEELMKYDYCNAALNVTASVVFTTGGEPNYTGVNSIAYVDAATFAPSVPDVGYKMITVTVTAQGSTYSVYSVVTKFQ
jgi:type II secretory pathway pseudopilin PulG